jgi:bacterioferritin-associated ferredoxin
MYICICNAISDRSVRGCSANSVADVFRSHGARPQCGQCVPHLRQLLAEMMPATLPQPAEAGD